MYNFSYVTTEGIVKTVNQDALLIKIAEYKKHKILFSAVCDGMGGLYCGEKASSFVISGVSEWFEKEYPKIIKKGGNILEIRQSLDECLHRLNDDIIDNTEKGKSMGTTFTSLLIDPILDITLTGHVGDTRLYKIFTDHIEVVTMDHSVVAEEVRRGIISEEEARNDSRQNQITNCIGVASKNRIYDFIIQTPQTDCVYMICSDGFRKMITETEINTYLSPDVNLDNDSLKSNLERLLALNIQRKETDNITALALKYTKGNDI
ncbi:MAG: hypothetical protein NC177_02600 [Ruminococcus flavefaciens]|nr:hypothetical protein [Ruminococcus flavefaciens]